MIGELGMGLTASFCASAGFTFAWLPTRYLKRAEFAWAATKAHCSGGATEMRRVTATGAGEPELRTARITKLATSAAAKKPRITFRFVFIVFKPRAAIQTAMHNVRRAIESSTGKLLN